MDMPVKTRLFVSNMGYTWRLWHITDNLPKEVQSITNTTTLDGSGTSVYFSEYPDQMSIEGRIAEILSLWDIWENWDDPDEKPEIIDLWDM